MDHSQIPLVSRSAILARLELPTVKLVSQFVSFAQPVQRFPLSPPPPVPRVKPVFTLQLMDQLRAVRAVRDNIRLLMVKVNVPIALLENLIHQLLGLPDVKNAIRGDIKPILPREFALLANPGPTLPVKASQFALLVLPVLLLRSVAPSLARFVRLDFTLLSTDRPNVLSVLAVDLLLRLVQQFVKFARSVNSLSKTVYLLVHCAYPVNTGMRLN